jgi:radical SAM protein with 4Fe4S-binding SPASM domain
MTEPKRKARPELVGWGITDRCNLSCPHCYSAAKKDTDNEMTTDRCMEIIDELADLGVNTIGWTGGEPLLRDDLETLIDYAGDKYHIESAITTNGVLLDKTRANSLKNSGVEVIQISLDGSTPEKNFRVRRASREEFRKVIEAIRICRDLGFKVHLAMLLGQGNLDDARSFLKQARLEKVASVRFCGFVPAGRGKGNSIKKRFLFTKRKADLKKFVEEFVESENPITMFDPGFGPLPPDYRFHPCIAGVKTFYLSAGGTVYPCTSLLHDQFAVGNVGQKKIQEIWNNPAMYAMAAFSRRNINGQCRTCDHFQVCKGACRGLAYAHTGDVYASYPLCLYNI